MTEYRKLSRRQFLKTIGKIVGAAGLGYAALNAGCTTSEARVADSEVSLSPDGELTAVVPETQPPDVSTDSPSEDQSSASAGFLLVEGRVNNPLNLSYDDVLAYPAVTTEATLFCPGVYENQSPRNWHGVPVDAILEAAAVQPEASRVVFYAADGYKTTLSIERLKHTGAILAYKVDDAFLSKGDGYPFRLVAGDLIGDVWIRSVNRLEVA